jgi:hypothetical protein
MITNFRHIVLILLTCLSSFASAENLQSKEALSSFLAFVKGGKHQEAANLIFTAPGKEAATLERVKTLSNKAAEAGESAIEIVTGKELGTVARLIVKDTAKDKMGKPDHDGILMIKRDDAWKVVINAREIEETSGIATPEEHKALQELRKWQDTTMESLSNLQN